MTGITFVKFRLFSPTIDGEIFSAERYNEIFRTVYDVVDNNDNHITVNDGRHNYTFDKQYIETSL